MVFPKIGKKESAKKDDGNQNAQIGGEQRREKTSSSKERVLAGRLHALIKAPRVTEKSASLVSAANTYTFEIARSATKGAVKDAVEALYGVDVANVRMVRTPSKKRRLGRYEGERKQIKKALVEVQKGQKIDIGF